MMNAEIFLFMERQKLPERQMESREQLRRSYNKSYLG